MDKFEVSDEKQECSNRVKKRWNNCRIKDTSQDPYILFNELFHLNLKFKKNKAKYEKDDNGMIAYLFDVLP